MGGLCLKQSPTPPAARRPNESAIPRRPAHLRETRKPGAGKHFAIFRTATFPQVARSVRLDRAALCFGEPSHRGYMLTRLDCLANVSSLEHERWKRAHPKFCRRMGAT